MLRPGESQMSVEVANLLFTYAVGFSFSAHI